MSEGYLLLVIRLSQSLVVRPEAVVVLEELPEELYWQDWMQRLLWMGPEVEVSERKSNCIGTKELCLLLQSGICRCPQFRMSSTVVSP